MESEFNLLAVFIASVAAMALGGLWYSPLLFEKPWRNLVAATENSSSGNPAVIYGGSFLLMIIGAFIFHMFSWTITGLRLCRGRWGLAAGLSWAAGSLWISYLFEGRRAKLYLINGGYHIAQYTLYGIIFGLM